MAAALTAGLALAGCSWGEEEQAPVEAQTPPQGGAPGPSGPVYEKRPVASVESLEIGQIYRGRLLTAHGAAPATGWFHATLEPRNGSRLAPDGFLEFDLVAAPPELNGGEPGVPARLPIRADRAIPTADLVGAQGVRVYAGATAAALRVSVSAPQPGQAGGPRTQAVFSPVAPTRSVDADDPASAPPTPPRIGQ
ncbi:hypothetical protein [Albimonas pacifica]|uniref:hypothetical protein n=1 Tax=Albimonas pacifica TaxID=1114924 RepID=UPI000B81104B|nr:hypothetical protein [Albimonas pacifica]